MVLIWAVMLMLIRVGKVAIRRRIIKRQPVASDEDLRMAERRNSRITIALPLGIAMAKPLTISWPEVLVFTKTE